MNKKVKTLITLVVIAIIVVTALAIFFNNRNEPELQTIKSEKQLLDFYEGEKESTIDFKTKLFGMPFTGLAGVLDSGIFETSVLSRSSSGITKAYIDTAMPQELDANTVTNSSSKDYSTTNIQVENVDEADITKTDGDYIYSISNNQVIITNVKDPKKPVIASRINARDSSYPEDLILYKNKLVVISQDSKQTYYSSSGNTIVSIYNINSKENPLLEKGYELYEPYYTSRCIDNKLYVISSGYLKKENNKIVRKYKEDYQEKEIALDSIKYLKDINTTKQTIFSTLDLENVEKDVKISSYLIDISNAYVSKNSFYLLNEEYENGNYHNPKVKDLFGPGGVIGFFHKAYDYDYDYSNSGYKTKIYKFDIKQDGNIEYVAKTKTDGETINQYSLDEKNGHLRVALHDYNGSRIAIFDENLNKIGETESLAKNENMYSSRFIGDRAYMVTYRTVDPLWVIDLSNETNPKVLGELSIPGYSTYLHPYDETHLIGIGMETKENINRDSQGRVISTTATIVGMKMALFDVSNVSNPTQISSTIIGDNRTTSAILTNPKALLFSKQKQLIAIPVNNYSSDFEVEDYSEDSTYYSIISAYNNESKDYIGEGYLVYKINLEEGFKQKGIITHKKSKSADRYSYYYTTKMLRGMYIDNNLYTVSETQLKVNDLETLKQISELKIEGE